MDKVEFNKQFSSRLREAMIEAGFNSQRSISGVSIHKLAEITGYSMQICRKYLRGEAIPDPLKLIEIASKLKVSAGWLLFGDRHSDSTFVADKVIISKNLLLYILKQAAILYTTSRLGNAAPGFLLTLINDVSQINTSEEQSKKMIDLALLSVKYFSNEDRAS